MANAHTFRLTIYSEFTYLDAVADFVTRVAEANGLNERAAYNVQMAVDEAVTNVIEHAYKGRKDGRIDLAAERRGNELVIEIRDLGKPFDASRVREPRIRGPLSRRSVGGLGVYFMKRLMDQVEFSTNPEGGNLVRMVKRVR